MKNKKILIVTGIYPPSIGGPATYSKLMVDNLPRYGIIVKVVSFDEVRHLPTIIRHILLFVKIVKKLQRVDVVFAQDTISVGFPALLAAKLFGKRFFLRVPGDYAWEQGQCRYGIKDDIDSFQSKRYGFKVEMLRSIQKFVANHSDKIITPSLYFKHLVLKWVNDKSKVYLIYNGTDILGVGKSNKYHKKKTIITAGRLVPWKCFDELIYAISAMPDWEIWIAGDGPDKERLINLALDKGISHRVIFLGKLSKKNLTQKLQEAEVFVLNSSFESFSFQIVEAMVAGVPVVAANIGNISEIITDGDNGMLYKKGDYEALRKILEEISNDNILRTKLIHNGYIRAADFSIDKTIAGLVKLI